MLEKFLFFFKSKPVVKCGENAICMLKTYPSIKIKVKKKEGGLQIFGKQKNKIVTKAKIKTYYDHRIAMAFLVMGLASKKKIITKYQIS